MNGFEAVLTIVIAVLFWAIVISLAFRKPCSCNKKRLWFIPYRGNHEYKIVIFGVWAFEKWEMDIECQYCGETHHAFGLDDSRVSHFFKDWRKTRRIAMMSDLYGDRLKRHLKE